MKKLSLYIIVQFLFLAIQAEKVSVWGPRVVIGAVELSFKNGGSRVQTLDSALVIFDRYDRSGAGIIYKVFYTNPKGEICIPDVPAGKYFVTIQWMGIRRDRIEKVINVKPSKCEKVQIALQPIDEITKEDILIPAEHFDTSKLCAFEQKK